MAKYKKPSVTDWLRFTNKVQIDDINTCHIWVGTKTQGKYGVFNWHKHRYMAHRIIWEWTYGEIPDKMLICHKCDNPSCVNIKHLFLGNYKDNMQDAVQKGRMKRSPNAGRKKLRTPKHKAIVQDYQNNVPVKQICETYGCTRQWVLFLVKESGTPSHKKGRLPNKLQ